MRVLVRSVSVALAVASAVMLGAVPASAVDLVSPVDPIPGLPSTNVKAWHSSAGGIGNQMLTLTQWWLEQSKAGKIGAAVPAGVQALPKVVPITAPAALPKLSPVAAGGPAGLAMSGWFVIGGTGAAVSFVGSAVGADLDNAMCGADQWVQTGYGILTMGMGPGCKAPITNVNQDATTAWSLSYAGATWTLLGIRSNASETVGWSYCYSGPANAPTGYRVQSFSGNAGSYGSSGTWSASSPTFGIAPTSSCTANFSGTTRQVSSTPSRNGFEPAYRLVDAVTGEVVATGAKGTGDPMRDSTCTLTWKDGSKTTGHVGQYRESEGFPIGAVDAACTSALVSKPGGGPGLLPSEIDISSTNTETGAKTEIARQPVPDFTESEKVGLTPGDNTGLRLLKTVNGVIQSCMTWEAACAGWWDTSSQGTNSDTYKCQYGGREVSLVECGPYRQTFDTQTSTPTITDPNTGQQAPWSSTTDPANTPGTGGQAGQSPSACVVSFSLNPVDWVMRPLRCLFEPSQAAVNAWQNGMSDKVTGSSIGAITGAAVALGDAYSSGVGCGGLPLHLEAFGSTLVDTYLLASCEEPAAGIAATVKIVLSIAVWGGALLAIMRYLGALFGFVGLGRGTSKSTTTVEFS